MTDWKERAERAEAELARLRAQVPVGWIGPSGFTHNTATNRMWMRESPKLAAKLSPVYAAPPAQPAEPVQRLSDERAAFEAWHNEYRTQELVRRDDTYYNTHVRCRWEGWQARAIESALQPGWRDIESAPKDGTRIILGSSDGAWMAEYQPVYQSGYRPDNPWFSVMLNHAHMGRFPKAKPTHWQPIPPAPKATK